MILSGNKIITDERTDERTNERNDRQPKSYIVPPFQSGAINTINATNKSQEVSPFPAGDHKAAMNRPKNRAFHRNQYIPQ